MKLFYGIVLVLIVFISACAQQPVAQPEPQPSAPPAPPPEPEPKPVDVAPEEDVPVETSTTDIRYVGAGGFDPSDVTISVGSSVTFFNDDSKPIVIIIFKDGKTYTVISRMNPGQQTEHEFTEPGAYQFWWNIAYAAVGGTITVQ